MSRGCMLLLVLAVAGVVSACAADGPPQARETSDRPPLRISFERPRYLVIQRKAELILRNDGDVPVTVNRLQLASDWFERVAPTARSVEVAPGRRIDVPVPYGQALCDVADSRHQAVLDIAGEGPATLPLEDADEALELVHTEECNRKAVQDAVEITIINLRRVGGAPAYPLRGDVVLRRKSFDQPVTIESLRGGVIFLLDPLKEGKPVLTLKPGAQEARAGVLFRIARCDPHGMAESKKTYRFPFDVALGEGEARYVEVEPVGDERAVMEATLNECANF